MVDRDRVCDRFYDREYEPRAIKFQDFDFSNVSFIACDSLKLLFYGFEVAFAVRK